MKTKAPVYVVTRNGRRIEAENYSNRSAAKNRAQVLREMLKKWDDPDLRKVDIVNTSKPNQIR